MSIQCPPPSAGSAPLAVGELRPPLVQLAPQVGNHVLLCLRLQQGLPLDMREDMSTWERRGYVSKLATAHGHRHLSLHQGMQPWEVIQQG